MRATISLRANAILSRTGKTALLSHQSLAALLHSSSPLILPISAWRAALVHSPQRPRHINIDNDHCAAKIFVWRCRSVATETRV